MIRHRKGIPTSYAGINFRSRLEATWAAFFDYCCWEWEYEPFDLPGYIPDFLIKGVKPFIVDVRPAASLQECVTRAEELRSICADHSLLVIGASLFKSTFIEEAYAIGVMSEDYADGRAFEEAILTGCPCGAIGFYPISGAWTSPVCGHACRGAACDPWVKDGWSKAKNAAQWKAVHPA